MDTNGKNMKKSAGKLSRRTFLGAGATAFTIAPRAVLAQSKDLAPSQKVNLAFIGLGGQGMGNLENFLDSKDTEVVALCDVERGSDDGGRRRGRGLKGALGLVEEKYASRIKSGTYKGCSTYVDFKEMLDKETSIDAVVVSTPDHTHAVACMAAINKGKHVFCEKPLAHSIYEVRTVTEAARKAGVATQMGNQGHSGEGIRLTVEWIRAGAIGPVHEVHGWTMDGGLSWTDMTERPSETPAPPETLDWDRWIGPAADRPYHPAYAPYNWRGWWDFGSGGIGDMACHNLDPAFWALDLGHPTTIEASSSKLSDETVPAAATYHYEFPARGDMPPLRLSWYDGGVLPPRPKGMGDRELGFDGIYFVGEEGVIKCGGWGGTPRIIPESKMKSFKRPKKTIPRTPGHHQDWIDACKKGGKSSADFDYSGPLTEMVLLGNVALRSGERLHWDGEKMKATNTSEAEKYIHPEFRKGWEI